MGVTVDEPAAGSTGDVPLPPRKQLGPHVVKTRMIKVGELIEDAAAP